MRLLFVLLVLSGCLIVCGDGIAQAFVTPPPERYALYADFDNKVPNDHIGTRGGVFGEPIAVSQLEAVISELTPGENALLVTNNLTDTTAKRLKWQWMGNAELNTGVARISFDLTTSALDKYSIIVRESGTSTKKFLYLVLTSGGSIIASDASGVIGTTSDAYAAFKKLHVDLLFDMTARTSNIYFDGKPIAVDRAFGITDRGIGSISIGYSPNSNGSAFILDNLKVRGPLPFALTLDADFDNKIPGNQIGLRGAVYNEPASTTSDLDSTIVADGPLNNFLEIASRDTTTAQSLRWQFANDTEISSGLVVMDFDLVMTQRDAYTLGVCEPTTSKHRFIDLLFMPDGSIQFSDDSTTPAALGADYNAGQPYQYRLVFNMDAGTYDLFRDGEPLLRERAHGITSRGIGAFLNIIDRDASKNAHVIIDSLRVYSSDLVYIDGFDRAAM